MKNGDTILLLGALALILVTIAFVGGVRLAQKPDPAGSSEALVGPGAADSAGRSEIEVVDFLPRRFATDGSVDYTREVQHAIDAAEGRTLVLPPFPVRVAAIPGQLWCLRITKSMAVRGSPGSVLRETKGGRIILYAEHATGLRFEGFALEGNGKNGVHLAHGILQVTWCRDVLVRDLRVSGSDADGIAVAASEDVRVLGCSASHCSKAALYVNSCTNAVLQGNVTRESGGHVVPGGRIVGSAIQISSNKNLVCSGNALLGGIGIGILCNALPGRAKPEGCVVANNVVEGFRNPTNMDVSGGIRCENGHPEKDTHTSVTSNSIRDCGHYGLFLEGHDGALVSQNTIADIDWSGILISAAHDVTVVGNLILNVDTSLVPGKAYVHLLNGASRVVLRGNRFGSSPDYAPCGVADGVLDASGGTGNDFEPAVVHAPAPPSGGAWSAGSLTWNTGPQPGMPLGWVCTQGGSPGTWCAFGVLP